MFKTVGNTLELMGASWKVLQQNRRLLWLPAMSGAAIAVLLLLLAGTLAAAGSFSRIESEGLSTSEYILFAIFYFVITFVVILLQLRVGRRRLPVHERRPADHLQRPRRGE